MITIWLTGPALAISCLGIDPYQWGTEYLSGDVSAGPATSFPQSIGMVKNFECCHSEWQTFIHYSVMPNMYVQAASFNYEMLYKIARAISDEVRAKVAEKNVYTLL